MSETMDAKARKAMKKEADKKLGAAVRDAQAANERMQAAAREADLTAPLPGFSNSAVGILRRARDEARLSRADVDHRLVRGQIEIDAVVVDPGRLRPLKAIDRRNEPITASEGDRRQHQ